MDAFWEVVAGSRGDILTATMFSYAFLHISWLIFIKPRWYSAENWNLNGPFVCVRVHIQLFFFFLKRTLAKYRVLPHKLLIIRLKFPQERSLLC